MIQNDRTTETLLSRRALAEKATPGPWEPDYRGMCIFTSVPKVTMIAEMRGRNDGLRAWQGQFNALHIAANSPNVVMADIDEILRLREEVKRLEKEADWLGFHVVWGLGSYAGREKQYKYIADAKILLGEEEIFQKDLEQLKEWREAARKAVESSHEN